MATRGVAVKEGVSEAAHEVGSAGAGSGHAQAGEAGGARVALGGEDAALLVPRQLRITADRVSAWWISINAPPGYANTSVMP